MIVALAALTTFVLFLSFEIWILHRDANGDLPPGPKAWPVVGNAWHFFRLSRNPTKWCRKLAREYGDLTALKIGGTLFVFINHPEAAHDLLQKNAGVTSGRPMTNSFRYDSLPGRIIVGPADASFRRVRKLYNTILSKQCAATWEQYQDFESLQLVRNLLRDPSQLFLACNRHTANIVSLAIYAQRFVEDDHDHMVRRLYGVWETMYLYFLPWTLPVDFFPSLLSLPKYLQPWQYLIDHVKGSEAKIQEQLLRHALTLSREGHSCNCLASNLLQGHEDSDQEVDSVCQILSMLHGAGSDTVSGAMQIFFKVVALNPEAMRIACKEIDDNVGPARLPSFEDRRRLPYVQAMIKETYRWAPLANVGVPHALNDDLVYRGYRLPKGTILIPNILILSSHPDCYSSPADFDPMRFYGDETDPAALAMQSDYRKRDHFIYGFGRRFCPGSHVAEATMFIAVARVLWAFEITASAGSKLSLEDQRDGLLRKPKPFPICIKPRQPCLMDKLKRAQTDGFPEKQHSWAGSVRA